MVLFIPEYLKIFVEGCPNIPKERGVDVYEAGFRLNWFIGKSTAAILKP